MHHHWAWPRAADSCAPVKSSLRKSTVGPCWTFTTTLSGDRKPPGQEYDHSVAGSRETALFGALAILFAACSSATTTHTSSTSTASPSGAQPAPQHLSWHNCSAGLQCATMHVPLDYSNPQGQQISLALARLPASNPSERIGSLLTNPGGPGESGITFLQEAGSSYFSANLRAHFDIVTWDPRGTGSSDPVQ